MNSSRKICFQDRIIIALTSAFLLCTGCASLPYEPGVHEKDPRAFALPEGEPQIERGRPNGFLDASGWIWPGSLLAKLILWNRRIDSHRISPETEAEIQRYLTVNDLRNVKVRVNQYRPGDEWHRLFRNRSIGAGWRYTVGVLSVTFYTILPGRFFGGDNYNPFTNTVNLYSDIPAVALHEGGHAKDFTSRKYKGTYAAANIIPFVPLYGEAIASSDAISYIRSEQTIGDERRAYNILYPAYGTHIGGSFGPFFPDYSTLISAGAAIPGHVVGRVKSAAVKPKERTNK